MSARGCYKGLRRWSETSPQLCRAWCSRALVGLRHPGADRRRRRVRAAEACPWRSAGTPGRRRCRPPPTPCRRPAGRPTAPRTTAVAGALVSAHVVRFRMLLTCCADHSAPPRAVGTWLRRLHQLLSPRFAPSMNCDSAPSSCEIS